MSKIFLMEKKNSTTSIEDLKTAVTGIGYRCSSNVRLLSGNLIKFSRGARSLTFHVSHAGTISVVPKGTHVTSMTFDALSVYHCHIHDFKTVEEVMAYIKNDRQI